MRHFPTYLFNYNNGSAHIQQGGVYIVLFLWKEFGKMYNETLGGGGVHDNVCMKHCQKIF